MAGARLRPATQVPPSPQKESTNWHYPPAKEPMRSLWRNFARRIRRIGALQRERQRLFQEILDPGEELRAVGAVENSVVAHERERHLVARHDLAIVVDRRLLVELADREDRRLWRVDDRREVLDPEHAEVRHRERAARELRRRDRLLLDLADHRTGVAGDLAERLLVGVE